MPRRSFTRLSATARPNVELAFSNQRRDLSCGSSIACSFLPLVVCFDRKIPGRFPPFRNGLWATSPRAYAWLREYLTVERLRDLLTEAADLPIDRYELPNLLALNFVIHGLLAPGVSATTRPDAQAKGLGEYLRSRIVPVPADLL